ncbi:MAG: hypothetical protein D6B27_00310 [Gammaproteobacteria bacterium]|nr:MAG: hypothetical protein D6B27_00310 [Gammaproteobacteria bacterium]
MDNKIYALKCFIDGLGVRDVEFPEDLTDAEILLIMEMGICAASQIKGGDKLGFKDFLDRFVTRSTEEIGKDKVKEILEELQEKL